MYRKRFQYLKGPIAEMHPSLCDGSNSGCGSSADGAAKREAGKVPASSSRYVATWPLPVHPDVRLKPLPFYDAYAQGELLKPSSLSKLFICWIRCCLIILTVYISVAPIALNYCMRQCCLNI